MSDKITIQSVDRLTSQLNRSGDVFRVMFMDKRGMRHTVFCKDIQACLDTIKEILENRTSLAD